MNKLKIFLCFFLSIIIQITLVPNINFLNASMNMSISFIVALSMNFGSYFGGYSGVFLGLIEDILFSQVIGIRALIYYIIGFLVGYNENSINKGDIRSGSIITALSTVFYWSLSVILYMVIGSKNYIVNLAYFKGPIFIEIFFNILLYIITDYVFRKIFKKEKFKF